MLRADDGVIVLVAENPLAAGFASRFQVALPASGLSPRQFAKHKLGCSRGRVEAWLAGVCFPTGSNLVEVAYHLGVDPRWLATGMMAPAAGAACDVVRKQVIDRELATRLTNTLTICTIEPDCGVGTCRYCGCTFDNACPEGCEWVDDEQTICSACLQPAEAE